MKGDRMMDWIMGRTVGRAMDWTVYRTVDRTTDSDYYTTDRAIACITRGYAMVTPRHITGHAIVYISLLLSLGILCAEPLEAHFFLDHGQGWHWYETPAPEEEQQEDAEKKEAAFPKAPQGVPKSAPKSPKEILSSYRQELENRLAQAWLNPTSQNIQRYQEMQKDMLDRSKTFSRGWMQTVFTNPTLDHSLISPVNQKARHVHLDRETAETKKTIKMLSKDYGLFFFFRHDCPYCHQFAPIVKQFSEIYGWEVLAIHVGDPYGGEGGGEEGGYGAGHGAGYGAGRGEGLKDFPNAIPDNGLFDQWTKMGTKLGTSAGTDHSAEKESDGAGKDSEPIRVLPTLFAVNPSTGHVIPVAYGLTSLDQMEARIVTLLMDNPATDNPMVKDPLSGWAGGRVETK